MARGRGVCGRLAQAAANAILNRWLTLLPPNKAIGGTVNKRRNSLPPDSHREHSNAGLCRPCIFPARDRLRITIGVKHLQYEIALIASVNIPVDGEFQEARHAQRFRWKTVAVTALFPGG